MTEDALFSSVDWHPSLVGQGWSNFHGASALSVLTRLARLNYLESGDIRQALGISIRRRDDVFLLMSRSQPRLQALANAQDFDSEFVSAWYPSWWWPFANDIPFDVLQWTLRICPQCMRFAYHSLIFQMPGIDRCPWHGTKLVDGCVKCARPLLEGFDQGGQLLQCRCGHDHVDDQESLIGDVDSAQARRSTVQRYRAWVSPRQTECWLMAPEIADSQAWSALALLARSPFPSEQSSHGMVVDVLAPKAGREIELGASSGLEKFKPTIASLPKRWLRDSQAICRRLSTMMPPGTLTVAERRALDSGSQHSADASCHATRTWLLGIPGYPVGSATFLHTSPLDGVTLRAVARLACGIDATSNYVIEPADRRAFRMWIQAADQGPSLLEATIRRVLFRGYADGCRVFLGQMNPDLYAGRSTRPARRFPWVELRLGLQAEARIVWTRQMMP